MTLDEAIIHVEDVAVEYDKLCKRYDDASGYSRSHNESIRVNEAKLCEKRAKEHRQLAEWLKDYMRLLEQKPCEDCVNRQAVLNTLFYKSDNNCEVVLNKELQDRIKTLPPVTPQPKIGRWFKKYGEDSCGERYSYWVCSKCGRDVGFNLANVKDVLREYPFCHCGAKMYKPQEGE